MLDATHCGLRATPLPQDKLYQLTLDALAHPTRSASILYPAADPAARVQRTAVQDPIRGGQMARVALVPMALGSLGDLIEGAGPAAVRSRRRLAAAFLTAAG